MRRQLPILSALLLLGPAHAQEGDATAEMAAALQDPLANISAIMTENDIYVGTGTGQATTVMLIEPVRAFPLEKINLIPRGIFPIIGLAPEARIPPVAGSAPSDDSTRWELSDSVFQLYISPKTDSAWKWGIGPQVSLKTRTRSSHKGAGWGGGAVGVLVGGFGENVSAAFLVTHMEGEDDYSLTTLQPYIYYNFPNAPGLFVGYNAAITYDHNITSGDRWQLPLGVVVGRTTDLGGGWGLDLSLGAYDYPVKPDGGPDWSFKFGISLLLPR